MIDIEIDGININFPFKAYSCQLSMMTRIIECLNSKKNSLLESPTGTGKTMALLCSTLAWQRHVSKICKKDSENTENKRNEKCKIFYCTRTHKQIGQVVRELSRSPYKETKMDIVASKHRTCVNNSVLESENIDQACKDHCSDGLGCIFKNRMVKQNLQLPNQPWNLEDMRDSLKKEKICPYFQTRDWLDQADLILCPYNYIVNPGIRKATGINLKNSIIIFDEGHNIEDVCRDAASITLSQENLVECRKQLNIVVKYSSDFECDCLLDLVNKTYNLINVLSVKMYFAYGNAVESSWSSTEVSTLLVENGITVELIKTATKIIGDKISQLETFRTGVIIGEHEEKLELNQSKLEGLTFRILQSLESWLSVLSWILFDNESSQFRHDFRFVISEGKPFANTESVQVLDEWLSSKKKKLNTNLILDVYCLNPGVTFNYIMNKAHSIILTSGTLAPHTSFQSELSCKFDLSLEAFHVVKRDQTMIVSASRGPSGQLLEAVYRNVNSYPFQDELGRLIFQSCKIVPKGVLCFVSSFFLMEKLYERWSETGLMKEISQYKEVFIEPRNITELEKVMKNFYRFKDTGALLLGVYRGKLSEGMDFSDDAARLVISVGIPYPSVTDPQVSLKRNYNTILTEKSKLNDSVGKNKLHSALQNQQLSGSLSTISGSEWYSIQAYRALNQAIGRCIRHQNDWGVILLVDSRFEQGYASDGLCKWIKQRRTHYSSWGALQIDMEQFISRRQLVQNQPEESQLL